MHIYIYIYFGWTAESHSSSPAAPEGWRNGTDGRTDRRMIFIKVASSIFHNASALAARRGNECLSAHLLGKEKGEINGGRPEPDDSGATSAAVELVERLIKRR